MDKPVIGTEQSRDFLIMKALAEAAAEAAAEHLAARMRDEMRNESGRLRQDIIVEIQKDIQSYHGDMTPTSHVVAHSRLDRLLGIFEKVGSGVWTNIGGTIVKGMVFLILFGYFIWNAGLPAIGIIEK